jgi:site-specific recombinase XerD
MTRELVIVPMPKVWHPLPVVKVDWLPDILASSTELARRRSPITLPGYRKGLKPPNWQKRYPASPPSQDEMLRILDLCDVSTKRGVRNRALLTTLWRSGLRISEALALLPHEVDFQHCTVTVMSGKGGKRRVSGIDKYALAEISRWLMCRAMLNVPEGSPLFCTVNSPTAGNPVHPAYVRTLLRTLRVRAKVPHRVAPHQLRHSHAVELAREGVPVPLISRQLGHSNVATTATYLSGINPQEVIDLIALRPAPGALNA